MSTCPACRCRRPSLTPVGLCGLCYDRWLDPCEVNDPPSFHLPDATVAASAPRIDRIERRRMVGDSPRSSR
jgi:hypothetical protein